MKICPNQEITTGRILLSYLQYQITTDCTDVFLSQMGIVIAFSGPVSISDTMLHLVILSFWSPLICESSSVFDMHNLNIFEEDGPVFLQSLNLVCLISLETFFTMLLIALVSLSFPSVASTTDWRLLSGRKCTDHGFSLPFRLVIDNQKTWYQPLPIEVFPYYLEILDFLYSSQIHITYK